MLRKCLTLAVQRDDPFRRQSRQSGRRPAGCRGRGNAVRRSRPQGRRWVGKRQYPKLELAERLPDLAAFQLRASNLKALHKGHDGERGIPDSVDGARSASVAPGSPDQNICIEISVIEDHFSFPAVRLLLAPASRGTGLAQVAEPGRGVGQIFAATPQAKEGLVRSFRPAFIGDAWRDRYQSGLWLSTIEDRDRFAAVDGASFMR